MSRPAIYGTELANLIKLTIYFPILPGKFGQWNAFGTKGCSCQRARSPMIFFGPPGPLFD